MFYDHNTTQSDLASRIVVYHSIARSDNLLRRSNPGRVSKIAISARAELRGTNETIEKLSEGRISARTLDDYSLCTKYVHVLGARESDESKGKREDTEGGEDEGACEGGERQREDGREAAATTRTPP